MLGLPAVQKSNGFRVHMKPPNAPFFISLHVQTKRSIFHLAPFANWSKTVGQNLFWILGCEMNSKSKIDFVDANSECEFCTFIRTNQKNATM
jgi:hypothetical protein